MARRTTEMSEEDFEATYAEWERTRGGYRAVSIATPYEIEKANRLLQQQEPSAAISLTLIPDDIERTAPEKTIAHRPKPLQNNEPGTAPAAAGSSASRGPSPERVVRRDMRTAAREFAQPTSHDRKTVRDQARLTREQLRRHMPTSALARPTEPTRRPIYDESIAELEAKLMRDGKLRPPGL